MAEEAGNDGAALQELGFTPFPGYGKAEEQFFGTFAKFMEEGARWTLATDRSGNRWHRDEVCDLTDKGFVDITHGNTH